MSTPRRDLLLSDASRLILVLPCTLNCRALRCSVGVFPEKPSGQSAGLGCRGAPVGAREPARAPAPLAALAPTVWSAHREPALTAGFPGGALSRAGSGLAAHLPCPYQVSVERVPDKQVITHSDIVVFKPLRISINTHFQISRAVAHLVYDIM